MAKYKGVIRSRSGSKLAPGASGSSNYQYKIDRQPGGRLIATSRHKFEIGDLVVLDLDASGAVTDISKA